MNLFSIGDIENLTNIKAHTIRMWEQRYGLCICKRKDSRHRYYDGEDLKQILRISWLYHKGVKISHIATLSEDEIREKALGKDASPATHELLINRLIELSISLDQHSLNNVMEEAIHAFGIESFMLDVIFPFLDKLGLFWLTGQVIPAQEHLASTAIVHRLVAAIHEVPKPSLQHTSRRILIFSPIGEEHEIPLLFMQYMLLKNGANVIYMGKCISIESIRMYCANHPVDELYFHLITNLTKTDINGYITELTTAFPQMKITCSGLSCQNIKKDFARLAVLETQEDFREFAGTT